MEWIIKEVKSLNGFNKAYMLESYCMDSIAAMNKTKQGLIQSLYNLGHNPENISIFFFDSWYIALID